MKVVLEKRVEKLGIPGEIVDVSDGYGRNYLLPHGCAVLATKANIEKIKKKVKILELQNIKEMDEAKKVAEQMEKVVVTLAMSVGENDKLFGSVTGQQIVDFLGAKGFEIEKRKVIIPTPIKQLGEYLIDIRLHPDVIAKIKVVVEKKSDE
jgi:large subunit ribosomal protein L9